MMFNVAVYSCPQLKKKCIYAPLDFDSSYYYLDIGTSYLMMIMMAKLSIILVSSCLQLCKNAFMFSTMQVYVLSLFKLILLLS